ncbi:hypothetical protein SESBI_42283 [Sesbania bispinosa]|nr:hypothetical protein SESBI_42283 [Sesbania bispinosa]
MANHNHLAAVLLLFLFVISPSSAARPFNIHFNLPSTEPTLNLALPTDRVEQPAGGHVSPCDHMRVAGKLPSPGMRLGGGKYGPMILNMLPKGKVPPSGPSKGTNNLNN